jgi:Pentapeptide repeats (8 copies)
VRFTIVVVLLISSVYALNSQVPFFARLQQGMTEKFAALPDDESLLCRQLLQETLVPTTIGQLKNTITTELENRKIALDICLQREQIKDLNQRYRESQTVIGRLGSVSGLVFAFITAIAAMMLGVLGTYWATSRTEAEEKRAEQTRKIDRDSYDFRLFESLCDSSNQLRRMAASAAIQARLAEINQEIKLIEKWRYYSAVSAIWRRKTSSQEVLVNLETERQTIIRVFLSTLKESRVRENDQGSPPGEDVRVVSNKTIAEGMVEALKCFSKMESRPRKKITRTVRTAKYYENDGIGASPLIDYDVQKLDLRGVYWGSKPPVAGYPGRGGFNGRGLDFYGSDFSGASLKEAFLEKAVFYGAKLYKAKFNGASLVGAQFAYAEVVGCDFSGADLTDCDFAGCSTASGNIRDGSTKVDMSTLPDTFFRG